MAIGIASQEAFAAGVLSDPGSGAEEPPRGWIWRASYVASQNGIGTPVVTPVFADIHGARKIENGEVYIIAENTAQVGTSSTMNFSGLVRLLVKLA